MKRSLAILSAAAFALGIGGAFSLTAVAAATPQTITIDASSTAMFSPAAITVHAGQPVQLTIVGQSGVHGIQSSDLGIPNTIILPRSSKTVTFTPEKKGTFIVHCSVPCGPDHAKMSFVVTVI